MSPCPPGSSLVLLASSIAIAISTDLTADQTNVLANFFSAIGDNLAIIAANKET
ncbi:hypothetical protein [Oscillibacter sp.]|uniref:hypothetical protein n=1 Tax=Oscillibacter sp. TaxID=1945593 RepID=UPI0033960F70